MGNSLFVVYVVLIIINHIDILSTLYWHCQVSVSSKSAKSDKQFKWEAEADSSSYTIAEETDAEKLIPRGTVITLHLKVLLDELPSSNL